MGKRKRRAEEAGAEVGEQAQPSQIDAKFDEGLKQLEKLTGIKQTIRRKIEGFKRRAKITPGTLRRLFEDIFEALD